MFRRMKIIGKWVRWLSGTSRYNPRYTTKVVKHPAGKGVQVTYSYCHLTIQ